MSQFKGSPNQALFAATLGFFIGFAGVSLFGPTAARFKEVMTLSPALVGLLVAMPALSGSLLRIPFSAWVDTTGGRKPFLVLLSLSIFGLAGLSAVTYWLYPDHLAIGYYPLLLLLGLLCGCGIATFSVGISQVSYWYPQKRQGSVLGTYAGFGNIAPGLFSFLLPVSMGAVGLTGSYLIWTVLLIIGTLAYSMLGRNAWYFQLRHRQVSTEQARAEAKGEGQELFPAGSFSESLKVSAGYWKTWALMGVYFTTFGGFIALTAWLPTYWQDYFSATEVTAGVLTAIYSVLTSVIRVPGGMFADRLGGERTLTIALLLTLLGAIGMTLAGSITPAVVAVVVLALGMGVSNAAVFKLVPQEIPKAVGGAAGWVGGLGAFGGFTIPPLMGLFVKYLGREGYALGFVIMIALAVISLGLARLLSSSHAGKGAEEPAHVVASR